MSLAFYATRSTMKTVALLCLVTIAVASAVTFDAPLDFDDDDGFQVVNNGAANMYPDFLEHSSVRFDECRMVRHNVEGSDKNMTERFVVFRLCPSDACKSCDYNYGEYVMELEEYLFAVSYYLDIEEKEKCAKCDEKCSEDGSNSANGDDKINCDNCVSECDKMENMGENGYMDAMEFGSCQMIFDGVEDKLYAGPTCTSSGTNKIRIGVFHDEDCQTFDHTKNVEDYLHDERGNPMRLAWVNWKRAQNAHHCIPCHTIDGLSITGLCEQLYDTADKCEKKLELGNEQQKAEEEACEFIANLHSGKFDG